MEKRYLSTKEMCNLYGVSHNTIRKYFDYAVIHIGKSVRFDLKLIEEGGMKWTEIPRVEAEAQQGREGKIISLAN